MKQCKLIATTSLCAVLGMGSVSYAAAEVSPQTEAKQVGVVMGSLITGGVAGGPLGAMAGFLAGVWMSEKVEDADKIEGIQTQLADARQEANSLALRLANSETTSKELAQATLDQLQLELLFKTGDGELTEPGKQRLSYLAEFLVNNPAVNVRLDGYADPRGGDAFNLALSEQRVQSVVTLLKEQGVDLQRIKSDFHGASQSSAGVGDYDSYALERVVKIQLTREEGESTLAQAVISH